MPCELSLGGACVWCVLLGSLYVGSLYAVPERLRALHRDHPHSSKWIPTAQALRLP